MSDDTRPNQHPTPAEVQDLKAVQSIPLDTEDGGTVVIEQQNMGGFQQVGGGEYKNVAGKRTVEEAAAEQADLEREAPVDGASAEDAAPDSADGAAPGAAGASEA